MRRQRQAPALVAQKLTDKYPVLCRKRKTYFFSYRAYKQPKGSAVKRDGKISWSSSVSSSCFPVNFHLKYSCHKSLPWPGGNVQSTLLIETAIIRWQHLVLFVFVTFRTAIVQIIKTNCLPTAKQATVAENLLMMPANRSYLQLALPSNFSIRPWQYPTVSENFNNTEREREIASTSWLNHQLCAKVS